MEEQKEVTYVSKYFSLRIVMKPSYNTEVGGRVVTHTGESVRFEEGVFKTDDPKLIEALEARPEFGSAFIRVPDDTEAVSHRDEMTKDLETRQKELDEREEDIKRREALIDEGGEAGRTASQGEVSDDLANLRRPALVEIAEGLEIDPSVWKPGTTNESIKEAIRAKRAENGEGETPEPGSSEGDEDGAY